MIYIIENIETNDCYVGFTEKTLDERFQKHLYNANSGGQTHLYKAIRKYGQENFQIRCLQLNGTFEDEKKWIGKLNPRYNMTLGGEGGDTSSSPNFLRAMKKYHSRKPKNEYATNGTKGKKHGIQTKRQQAIVRKEYWKGLTEEERKERTQKISGKRNGMFGKTPNNSVQVIVDGVKYNSKAAAGRALSKNWYKIAKEHRVKIL